MPAISENLIHFLDRKDKDSPNKQLKVFKSIITDGLRCNDFQVKLGSDGGIAYNKVVCFTDIPLSYCDQHITNYGKFGIGFKKSYVKRSGGNPARYFLDYLPADGNAYNPTENRGILYAHISRHYSALLKIRSLLDSDSEFCLCDKKGSIIFDYETLRNWYDEQILIMSFEKEMGDLGPARDEAREMDSYYKEREWRLVVTNIGIASGVIKERDSSYFYDFRRDDINMVVAPNDDIRTEVLKYFQAFEGKDDPRLKEFADNPVPVISYDDLNKW